MLEIIHIGNDSGNLTDHMYHGNLRFNAEFKTALQ